MPFFFSFVYVCGGRLRYFLSRYELLCQEVDAIIFETPVLNYCGALACIYGDTDFLQELMPSGLAYKRLWVLP